MKYLLPFLFLGLLTIISCKEDACEDVKLSITSLESAYNCANTASQMQINGEESFLIITSQDDFNAKIEGSCAPDIDFSKYMLLVGTQQLTNGLASIEYELIDDCESSSYEYNVNIIMDATTVAPVVTYHSLTPILEANGQVNFNITISN